MSIENIIGLYDQIVLEEARSHYFDGDRLNRMIFFTELRLINEKKRHIDRIIKKPSVVIPPDFLIK